MGPAAYLQTSDRNSLVDHTPPGGCRSKRIGDWQRLIVQPFVRGLDVTRTAWSLVIALAALGCDTADEVDLGSVTVDSAQVRAPVAIDTTSEGAHPSPEGALRAALEQVLRGSSDPQPEEHSWFSSATADALRSVSVDSAGHATVDFEDLRALIPNASSSAGSTMLLEELNSTVFSVEGVRSVDYLIEGSCERFWEWLQYSCQTVHGP